MSDEGRQRRPERTPAVSPSPGRRGQGGFSRAANRKAGRGSGSADRKAGRPGPAERKAGRGSGSADRTGRGQARSREQAGYDGPPLDDSITGRELDRSVIQRLRSLPDKLAQRVARHLVAAGQLIDDDPRAAYEHALAARARAARLAVVREACGEAAYATGEYAEALSELRAAKRMSGANDYLAVMADCERALGRPERALALARSPAVANLTVEQQAEMTIVAAGARRDLGDLDAALRTLEGAPLRSRARAGWVVRLRYAYADTLLTAGRREDAIVWFHRTAGVDSDAITDVAERLAELDGMVLTDTTEDPAAQ